MVENSFPGPIPMTRIDGDKIRALRESKDLTQLYMATVVGVTTDTISRWENRRYPSIKRENALKLAEALEVELTDILEAEPVVPEPGPGKTALEQDSKKTAEPIKWQGPALGLALILLLVLGAAFWFRQSPENPPPPPAPITVQRLLPAHTPAGIPFPVIIKITGKAPDSSSLIIKETLPPGCVPVQSVPLLSSVNRETGVLKWLSRAKGKNNTFVYLVKTSADRAAGEKLIFKGSITGRNSRKLNVTIKGDDTLTISGYHWADLNRDNRIEDDEILTAYDRFNDLDILKYDWRLLDDIWTGGGYRWDQDEQRYIILP